MIKITKLKKFKKTEKKNIVSYLKNTFPNIYYTHLSPKKIIKLYDKEQYNYDNTDEPRGLYYSLKFQRFLEGQYDYKYMYGIKFNKKKIYTNIVNPNKNLILQINTSMDEDQYVQKYGKNIYLDKIPYKIGKNIIYKEAYIVKTFDYKKLANDFAGIEFRNKRHSKYVIGYYVTENYGVIWNVSIIKELILMLQSYQRF
jgi:hypothetical protein